MKKILLAAILALPLNSFAIYVIPHTEATAWRATYAGDGKISRTAIAVSLEERKPSLSIMPIGKKPLKLYRLVLRESATAEATTVVNLESLQGREEITLQSTTGAGKYKFSVSGKSGETLLVEFEQLDGEHILDRQSFYLEPLLVIQQ